MWSVLCVPYVGGGIKYSDHHKELRTGHVINGMRSTYGGGI